MASDQISELPDSLFDHILSFLPTKQAITTCLSSKRWSHLRWSLPILDLDDFNFHSLHSFLQYADTIMSMRDHSETLRKFHLILRSTNGNVPRMKINTWINTAVLDSKVEHVEIYDKTLNKFNIEIPPRIFNCNTISILKLSGVKVAAPSFIRCPLLQDLALKFCGATDLGGYSVVPINKGRLKNLVSADVYDYPFTLETLSNVTALRIDTIGFSNRLHPATFYNLIHMEIRYYSPDFSRITILECLQNFPKLETLIIIEFNDTEWLGESVPECVSSHLKEFHLGNYRGLYDELELARFIMKNASFLNIISIRGRVTLTENSTQEMLQRLSSCPKSSVNCRLLFE
ncbi:F-box/FBD/LRR-repeat protein At5g56420-like [Neltuma alba]|uniref:F-box/FBD/LRR-repeat protein At5g56420-like n=1 Tax=Neltuma alba TaxID=207710 RepID=UPI0010A3BD71|nr:F-box/FBD/LRR-repeat protein At5g56420-like [Prosopis alba]